MSGQDPMTAFERQALAGAHIVHGSPDEIIPAPVGQTGEIAAALAKAQSEMSNAPLNKINPHFKSKYADLASIRDATIPHLTSNEMSLVQYTRVVGEGLLLITRLQHTSGEFIEAEYPLPFVLDKPQIMGSALTYARRYCWAAMCGIAAEDDDDANAANSGDARARKKASGPLTITELRKQMAAFGNDVRPCEDTDQLAGLMNKSQPLLDQCIADLPDWYYGTDNVVDGKHIHEIGAIDAINDRRTELAAQADERAAIEGE